MRGRVGAAILGAMALALVHADLAWAADGAHGESGADQSAGGELLGDGTAETWAEDGSDLGAEDQPRQGGGHVTCRWFGMDEGDNPAGRVDWDYMRNPPEELVGTRIAVLRVCSDDGGTYYNAEVVTLRLPTGRPPAVDPRRLALMARSRLSLPLPEARTSPDGDQTVNLETWLWVENWEEQSRTATAGGVTAVVVATPVEQRWVFGMPGEEKVCFDGGVPYDFSKEPSEQSTTCGYTFRHSSAGQPDDVFQVTATLVWHITWTSNVGASGDLGFVSRTVTIPTRVAEHQALNERGRSG